MLKSTDRILTTHVGSLPRPDSLLPFLERRQAGESIDEEAFAAAVEDATETVVRRQADAGIDIASHGEQGRLSFVTYAAERLAGFDGTTPAIQWADLEEYPEFARQVPTFNEWSEPDATIPAASGPVSYQGEAATEAELATFDRAVEATEATFEDTFVTAASPGTVTSYIGNDHYDDHESYLFAVAEGMQAEYELIAETGATLQIDSPDLLGGRHLKFKDHTDEEFVDIARLHVEALNEALENVPSDQVRMHVCWGNYEGPHHHDIPLAKVLPELYAADISGLLIEQANPCHQHDYRLFDEQAPPEDWVLVPGVIDVTVNYIEPPAVIADRIERVVDALGDPTRVIAGADCGLGTFAGFGAVHPEIAWEKLEALSAGAAEATDRLY
ncbi:MAG: cobalamin-independent methionine synthase II family protein [Halobacteriaceae archaeon]